MTVECKTGFKKNLRMTKIGAENSKQDEKMRVDLKVQEGVLYLL